LLQDLATTRGASRAWQAAGCSKYAATRAWKCTGATGDYRSRASIIVDAATRAHYETGAAIVACTTQKTAVATSTLSCKIFEPRDRCAADA
jgi:hypothetical protein